MRKISLYLLVFFGAAFVVIVIIKASRACEAYNGVLNEILRQQKIVADVEGRFVGEAIKVSQEQKLSEDFETMIYEDFRRIDPYGTSSTNGTVFIINQGGKSSVVTSLYCWMRGLGPDINKEASIKCLRNLYFVEINESGTFSKFNHFCTTKLLGFFLKKNYDSERLENLKRTTRTMIRREGGKEKESQTRGSGQIQKILP